MIYSILTREKLINLLNHGQGVGDADAAAGDNADVNMLSLDELKKKIQQHVAEDPFVSEQAPNVIAWKELSDPEATFSQCCSPAEVQKLEAAITERVNHSKTAVGALRRSALKTGDNAGNEDPEAMTAVTEMKNRILDVLPGQWKKDIGGDRLVGQFVGETNFIDDETLDVFARKTGNAKGLQELTSLHLCGSKKNVTYFGIEHCALPSVRLHVAGIKIVICASVVELMEHFGVNGLAEARDRFSTLAASDLPDASSGPL
eukprot:s300_g21.t1